MVIRPLHSMRTTETEEGCIAQGPLPLLLLLAVQIWPTAVTDNGATPCASQIRSSDATQDVLYLKALRLAVKVTEGGWALDKVDRRRMTSILLPKRANGSLRKRLEGRRVLGCAAWHGFACCVHHGLPWTTWCMKSCHTSRQADKVGVHVQFHPPLLQPSFTYKLHICRVVVFKARPRLITP